MFKILSRMPDPTTASKEEGGNYLLLHFFSSLKFYNIEKII